MVRRAPEPPVKQPSASALGDAGVPRGAAQWLGLGTRDLEQAGCRQGLR